MNIGENEVSYINTTKSPKLYSRSVENPKDFDRQAMRFRFQCTDKELNVKTDRNLSELTDDF